MLSHFIIALTHTYQVQQGRLNSINFSHSDIDEAGQSTVAAESPINRIAVCLTSESHLSKSERTGQNATLTYSQA